MSKVDLNNLTSLQNEASAINIINNNNDAIEDFSDTTLSRVGVAPNQMERELDMNSNRILNLPAPVTDTEPVRLQDIQTITEPATGNVISVATPDGGELTQFSGSTGKVITNYFDTGLVKTTSGVPSPAVAGIDYYAPDAQIIPISNGGTGASDSLSAFNNLKQQSTTSYQGVVELATTAEANTGTDNERAVTPLGVDTYYNGHINTSLSPYSKITRTLNVYNTNTTVGVNDLGNIFWADTGASTITVPAEDGTIPWYSQVDIINYASIATVSAASGANIISLNNYKKIPVNGLATLIYLGNSNWMLGGSLIP